MQNTDDKCILLFVKDPSNGVKTRLAVDIGPAAASELYKCFVFDLLQMLNELDIPFEISFHPPDSTKVQTIFGNSYHYMPQRGDDLGQRMKNAFTHAFEKGLKKVIIIGSDSPDLPAQFIKDAFAALDTSDAVIGPAADGGYYLIGFAQTGFIPQIFEGIRWSTDSVFKQTFDILKEHTDKIHILDQWYDIDTIDDVKLLLERNRTAEFHKRKTFSLLSQIDIKGLENVRL